ncbi:MAG: helix-turn-helix domain-containing protein [Nitrospira sp. BO4]|jgi:excisionase family DNA binding protein|nr:helix-turn-helix domain-containing protein [Nitrospira sp. BO4]
MKQPLLTKRLYSLPEAAMYLGRSTWSIRRLIWSGELPQVRAGGRVHVDVRDLDEFIDKNKVCEETVHSVPRRLDTEKGNVLSNQIT